MKKALKACACVVHSVVKTESEMVFWRKAGVLFRLVVFMVIGHMICLSQQAKGSEMVDTVSVADTLVVPGEEALLLPVEADVVHVEANTSHAVDTTLMHAEQEKKLRKGKRDSIKGGAFTLLAMLVPGAGQIVNKDYWKVPVFYGAIGGFVGLGIYSYQRYSRLSASPFPDDRWEQLHYEGRLLQWRYAYYGAFTAAALSYSLCVADALIQRAPDRQWPWAAMMSSLLFPGLGQVYNGAYWKVPIIYGAAFGLTGQLIRTQRLYKRFDRCLFYMLDDDPNTIDEFGGMRSQSELAYYRDYYQRYRDVYIIGLSLLYVLNVIDAYVDAHLFYWDVDENLAFRASPILSPMEGGVGGCALAMSFQLTI